MPIYWIEKNGKTNWGISPAPGGGDKLQEELQGWHSLRVHTVVSLLTNEEVNELDLQEEEQLCRKYMFEYIQFPIKDMGVPHDTAGISALIEKLNFRLETANTVLIHCRGGIGRSSIIAGALLLRRAHTLENAMKKISEQRGCEVPETEGQKQWLKNPTLVFPKKML